MSTTQIDDGVIKYHTKRFTPYKSNYIHQLHDLNEWRFILFQLSLIGEYDCGIGYGNMSKRNGAKSFFITATQTGKTEFTNQNHYTLVHDFDLEDFSIEMEGALKASSEALTHAAIYAANEKVQYIFHIHHEALWQKMLDDNDPKIPGQIVYGTPEMANEFAKHSLKSSSGLIVMEGHEDGVLAFGETAQSSGQALLKKFNELSG